LNCQPSSPEEFPTLGGREGGFSDLIFDPILSHDNKTLKRRNRIEKPISLSVHYFRLDAIGLRWDFKFKSPLVIRVNGLDHCALAAD
jgi:hypothetical protein